MRQMVLVCDDSCNSFFSGRPPPPRPSRLSFSISHAVFFFVLKWSSCATWAAYEHGHQALHQIWLNLLMLQAKFTNPDDPL